MTVRLIGGNRLHPLKGRTCCVQAIETTKTAALSYFGMWDVESSPGSEVDGLGLGETRAAFLGGTWGQSNLGYLCGTSDSRSWQSKPPRYNPTTLKPNTHTWTLNGLF